MNPTSPLGVGGLANFVFSLPKPPPFPARGRGLSSFLIGTYPCPPLSPADSGSIRVVPSYLVKNNTKSTFFLFFPFNMDVQSSPAIIPCKKYHKVHTRAFMPNHVKIIPNILCLHAFQHKNVKNPMLFHKKSAIFLPGRTC